MIKIESGVPIPQPKANERHGRPTKYPFRDMAPGDSFTCNDSERASVYAAARGQLGSVGLITVRKIGINEHRVWLKGSENE